jgi:Mg-chelatase subunit ChlI
MTSEKLKNRMLAREDPFKDILGQEKVKRELKSALIAGRNLIIVGAPGIGKTTLAKNVSKLDIGFKNFVRIQGSPDLTVEDILGDIDPVKALKHGPLSIEAFQKGKIFKADKGVLFFDELNRCPEKLQNALLQVLEEKKATIGSYDVDFDLDFVFIGTMNPEDTSTEKLSDVLLDRFDVIYMGYPEKDRVEQDIVKLKGSSLCEVPSNMLSAMVKFVRILRESNDLEKKPSVRASLGLYDRSQANALLAGRKKVNVDDLRDAVISVLSHRIKLKPSIKYLESPVEYVRKQFASIEDELLSEKGGSG